MALLTTLSLVAFAAPALPQETDDRIPVLLVSGANNHDWRWTTPSLARILEASGRFDVEVTYEPAKTLADRETLDSKKAVVLDYNGPRWGDAAEETFLAAVRDGLGVVVIHAADNHAPGWDEYEKLVGDLWRKGTGHGRFHPFDVTVTDRDHPVTRTLPTILQHPDELYHDLVNVHGVERRVLATAFSTKESGGTGEDEPMIVVKNFGEGRMFHTPLGHVWTNSGPSQASHRDPQFRGLVVRGTEWAATGMTSDTLGDVTNGLEDLADGFESLMDRDKWQTHGGGDAPDGWRFEDGVIVRTAQAGDIVTRELYEDFELKFEWKATVAGNSGVKYRVPAEAKRSIGPEYQLLDPAATTENLEHRAGALYDVVPASESPSVPWGYFHTARIVARGPKIEHWLDGVLVAEADTSSPEWRTALAESKFKDLPRFGAPRAGRVLLQDHGDEVWIRSMAIRRLDSDGGRAAGGTFDDAPTRLFPTTDLSAWSHVGDAGYRVEGNVLIGKAGPQRRQSFLVSNETFGDFALEVDVKIAVEGNSGIQLRSHVNDGGRLYGYQAEIDQTDRSWSAGIFDEARRGWIADLSDNEPARKAFDRAGWNRYQIICNGPHVMTWINGVPAADLLDGEDLTGRIGFQIHGGDDDVEIHWRDARVTRSGAHEWASLDEESNAIRFADGPGVRVRVGGHGTKLHLMRDDGSVAATVDVAAHETWQRGGLNRVTVLRDGERFVVQLGDATSHELVADGVTKVAFAAPGGGPSIRERWVCRKVR